MEEVSECTSAAAAALGAPYSKDGGSPFNNSMLTMHCDDAKKECLNGNRKTSTLRLAMPSYNHAMLHSCKKVSL